MISLSDSFFFRKSMSIFMDFEACILYPFYADNE